MNHQGRPAARSGERVVMLVQNGVIGDSRVQKEAESAAAAGWDVTLLGRARGRNEEKWRIGKAEVRLLPMKNARAPYEVRRAWMRSPLAYPPGPRRSQRDRQRRSWHAAIAEIKARQALEGPGQGALTRAARKAALLPRRVAVKVAGEWIRLRVRQTDRLQERRREMEAPLDRFTNWFWTRTMGTRVWRRFDPGLWEFEIAYGKVIDELEPDLIHANDFQMLGVGARAAVRLRSRGKNVKLVWDAHEFLPGIKPWVPHPRWHPAQLAHETEYAPYADAVVTVSEPIAHLLKDRHGLAELPTVVMNTPDLGMLDTAGAKLPNLREQCGLAPEEPLIVYSGAAAPQRGLFDMIEALVRLPGVHCAMVISRPNGKLAQEMRERAAELGVAERLHMLPYVEYWQVVPFLSSADAGLIPIHHYQNHELALITKFFEYSHARLPIVVSDVETMGGMVRETGQGEVFRAEDPADLARAVNLVLSDPKPYRKVYETGLLEEWTWDSQADRLHELYRRLLDMS
jgi:glycogen(starch) synthase